MNTQTTEQLKQEFADAYGINAEAVSFDKAGNVQLKHREMQVVAPQLLANWQSAEVGFRRYDESIKGVICFATIVAGERVETREALAQIGEELGDEIIDRMSQAIAIASARAYTNALNAHGFDLLRAHNQRMQRPAKLEIVGLPQGGLRRQLHALATNLGYIAIVNGQQDRTKYVKLLQHNFGEEVTTSANLDDAQVKALVDLLRADEQVQRLRRVQKMAA